MFVCPPNTHIPPHRHPTVDSYEVHLTPSVDFLVAGRRTIPLRALTRRDGNSSAFYGMAVRVRPGVEHEAFIGPEGGAFLSIQEWTAAEPTSVGNDWQGETMGPIHRSRVKARGYYRPIEDGDYAFLAAHMRPEDVAEMKATQGEGVNLETLLRQSVALSESAETGIAADTGEVVLIRGVAPLPQGGGAPWMLATPRAEEFIREFIVEGRKYVGEMLDRYGFLINYVDVRNTKSVRWLAKIGFTIHEPEPFGVQGLPFHKFTGTRINPAQP